MSDTAERKGKGRPLGAEQTSPVLATDHAPGEERDARDRAPGVELSGGSLTWGERIKTEVSGGIKTADKELAKIQTFALDAIAPLTAILEADAKDKDWTREQLIGATKAALQLIGNTSAKISHLRREKVVSHINQALMPIMQEEVNFEDSAPSLFGSGFAKKSKELMDQLKAMRTSIPKKGSRDQHQHFFRKGPSTSRSGGANYQRFSGNQHKFGGNRGGHHGQVRDYNRPYQKKNYPQNTQSKQ